MSWAIEIIKVVFHVFFKMKLVLENVKLEIMKNNSSNYFKIFHDGISTPRGEISKRLSSIVLEKSFFFSYFHSENFHFQKES